MNAEKILENCQHPIEGVVDMSTGHTIVCVACASAAIEAARVEERRACAAIADELSEKHNGLDNVAAELACTGVSILINARGGK